jgi:LemA protein
MLFIASALAAFFLLAGVVIFNRLVRARNLVREAWSGIDVQLKRRHDLVPGLAEAVRGYARHERGVLEDVAELRGRCARAGDVRARGEAEKDLSRGIKTLFAVAENYPGLRAGRNFLALQRSLSEAEDRIQLARRYYNGTARDYNIRVESFPGLLAARLFHFRPADFFEIEYATERRAPGVDLRA